MPTPSAPDAASSNWIWHGRRPKSRQLLELVENFDVVDQLPLLGVGTTARVFGLGPYVLKLAHPHEQCVSRLCEEAVNFKDPRVQELPIRLPKLIASHPAPDPTALVRTAGRGVHLAAHLWHTDDEPVSALHRRQHSLETLTRSIADRLPMWLRRQLLDVSAAVTALADDGLRLDLTPPNLYVDFKRRALMLVDLGVRLDPPVMHDLTDDTLDEALADALMRGQRRTPLSRRHFPPSGRFHVDVPVGRKKGAKVLWVNHELQRRRGWTFTRAQLWQHFAFDTTADDVVTTRPASRYQDSPGTGENQAQGDGRLVYAGWLTGSTSTKRPLEATLKGCGPTPLKWAGNAFHEDGRVSFQRTMWEACICDELARLGFDTPEILTVLSNPGATTVDQSLEQRPAATSVRVTHTHTRLGHLVRFRRDPDALRVVVRDAGRTVVRHDFDAQKPTHLDEFTSRFAHNLGFDVGRTDALQIHCFNPTLGNVRVDGHLLDFSTIRFFEHYVPDFIYMNARRKVREHRMTFRRLVSEWVRTLDGLYDDDGTAGRMGKALADFDAGFVDGFMNGFALFLGFAGPGCENGQRRDFLWAPTAKRRFVHETQRLRALRGAGSIAFAFWEQSTAAPQFDLVGRLPRFFDACRRGDPQPWRALLAATARPLTADDIDIAESWVAALDDLLPSTWFTRLRPRPWRRVVRPFMELERLAQLVYREAEPHDVERLAAHLSSSAALPEGMYTYAEARQQARRRRHVFARGLRPHRGEVVVGLTPEAWSMFERDATEHFGDRLRGVWAHGPRVLSERKRVEVLREAGHEVEVRPRRPLDLLEGGPHAKHSAALRLTVVLSSTTSLGDDVDVLRHLWRRCGWAVRALVDDDDVVVVPDDKAATSALVQRNRRRRLPLFDDEVVVLFDRDQEPPADLHARLERQVRQSEGHCLEVDVDEVVVADDLDRCDTGCALSCHQLTQTLADADADGVSVHPHLPVTVDDEGRFVLQSHAGAWHACRQAGRQRVRVQPMKPIDDGGDG